MCLRCLDQFPPMALGHVFAVVPDPKLEFPFSAQPPAKSSDIFPNRFHSMLLSAHHFLPQYKEIGAGKFPNMMTQISWCRVGMEACGIHLHNRQGFELKVPITSLICFCSFSSKFPKENRASFLNMLTFPSLAPMNYSCDPAAVKDNSYLRYLRIPTPSFLAKSWDRFFPK